VKIYKVYKTKKLRKKRLKPKKEEWKQELIVNAQYAMSL